MKAHFTYVSTHPHEEDKESVITDRDTLVNTIMQLVDSMGAESVTVVFDWSDEDMVPK